MNSRGTRKPEGTQPTQLLQSSAGRCTVRGVDRQSNHNDWRTDSRLGGWRVKHWIALAALLGPLSLASQANAQGFPTPVPLPNIVLPTLAPFATPQPYNFPIVTAAPVYN